ncbi:MAG: hypothetical protein IJT94_07915 [Oscillibacter sp.]|nr:hypothetical protein [Oscillibacter sp.]
MEVKDWITLIVPLVVEGILFYFFHVYYDRRLTRIERGEEDRLKVLMDFKDKIQKFRDDTVTTFQTDLSGGPSHENIQNLINQLLPLQVYFEAKSNDLHIFAKEFAEFQKPWQDFVELNNSHAGERNTPEIAQQVEEYVIAANIAADRLMQSIRKQMSK